MFHFTAVNWKKNPAWRSGIRESHLVSAVRPSCSTVSAVRDITESICIPRRGVFIKKWLLNEYAYALLLSVMVSEIDFFWGALLQACPYYI